MFCILSHIMCVCVQLCVRLRERCTLQDSCVRQRWLVCWPLESKSWILKTLQKSEALKHRLRSDTQFDTQFTRSSGQTSVSAQRHKVAGNDTVKDPAAEALFHGALSSPCLLLYFKQGPRRWRVIFHHMDSVCNSLLQRRRRSCSQCRWWHWNLDTTLFLRVWGYTKCRSAQTTRRCWGYMLRVPWYSELQLFSKFLWCSHLWEHHPQFNLWQHLHLATVWATLWLC